MPHITESKSESPPGLCDWFPTPPTHSLQSYPLPLPPRPHTQSLIPMTSVFALKYTRNAPIFGPFFWLFLLPWNFLQLGVYLANQFIFFRLLFRCYILHRSIQTTNLIWQFISFPYPDTLTSSTVSFFPRLLSLSALYNVFILRFIVFFPFGACELHESMGHSRP